MNCAHYECYADSLVAVADEGVVDAVAAAAVAAVVAVDDDVAGLVAVDSSVSLVV